MSSLVRRVRLPRLVHHDRLREGFGGDPRLREWTVEERIVSPCHWDDDAGRWRIGADQMQAIAPIQHLEDVDLRRREPLRELGVRLRLRVEPVRRRWGLRGSRGRQTGAREHAGRDNGQSDDTPDSAPPI
jgi:hypothetical protein